MEAIKGIRIKELPQILIMSLMRFDFDYTKMERVKINSRFEFDLELKSEQLQGWEYELLGVIIHSGSAHGGHYHAYIRDVINDYNQQEVINEHEKDKKKYKFMFNQ